MHEADKIKTLLKYVNYANYINEERCCVGMEKYKLLLVDDEEEVRSGMLQKIEWENYGFEIVGAAENGKEALEIIDKTLPDVVITDIKMPFMDGMELSNIIKNQYPMTKVIILTGFDEFEYAHKAIKLNITEYVLKPISANELINVLVKVKNQLDKEIMEKEDTEALREHYRKSIPILREKFLASLITSRLSKEEIDEKAKSYGINLSGKSFIVSVISIDKIAKGADTSIELYNEKQLLSFAVLNIVEETIAKYEAGIAFLSNEYIVIITTSVIDDDKSLARHMYHVLEEIRQTIERFLKITITIGVGRSCSEVTAISNSYQDALTALDYEVLMGNNRIILLEDIEPQSTDRIVFDEEKERTLANAIKLETEESVNEAIEMLFEGIVDIKASFKDYQIYVTEILTTILKTARNSDIDTDSIFGDVNNLYLELQNMRSKEENKEWLKEKSISAMRLIAKGRQENYKFLVEKAKTYINENYKNSELSIIAVCDYLHLSPTYFSFIFKKETKMTFVNYLTQIRMEAAKELLKTTNMKSFEIAEKVGYSDPNYFSYSFKKKFSISPLEYRNSFCK